MPDDLSIKGGWLAALICVPILIIAVAAFLITRGSKPQPTAAVVIADHPLSPKQIPQAAPQHVVVPPDNSSRVKPPSPDPKDKEIAKLREENARLLAANRAAKTEGESLTSRPPQLPQPKNDIKLDDLKAFATDLVRAMKPASDDQSARIEREHPTEGKYTSENTFTLDSIDIIKTDSVIHPLVGIIKVRTVSKFNAVGTDFFTSTFATLRVSVGRSEADGKWYLIQCIEKSIRLLDGRRRRRMILIFQRKGTNAIYRKRNG